MCLTDLVRDMTPFSCDRRSVGFASLLLASIRLYREVPHPDVARR
jgi:hypothetical protein